MTARDQKRLLDLFQLSTQIVTPVYRVRVLAALWFGNRCITVCSNSTRSHPFQKRYTDREQRIFLHAETAVLKSGVRLLGGDALEYCTIYIARAKVVDGRMAPGTAKPCGGCQRALAEFRIKKCFFTTEKGLEVL